MVRKIVGSVLAVALTTTAVLVASMLPEPAPAEAAACSSPANYSSSGTSPVTITVTAASGCTLTLPAGVTSVSYAVVGGGGGGGGGVTTSDKGGQGGRGGEVKTGTLTVTSGATLSFTVGAGGNGGAATRNGVAGGTSVLSVSGGSSVSALGGNRGRKGATQANNKGSGNSSGDGGGGAGSQNADNGEAGTSVALTSTSYGAGGGGGANTSKSRGTGSNGGGSGGTTGSPATAGSAGTANTGGGGGGGAAAATSSAGGNGGSGVVVIQYTPDASAPTVTLAATNASSVNQTIFFTVTGTEAIDCSTVTDSDFTKTNFAVGDTLTVQQTSPTVCTLTGLSSALADNNAVTSSLTASGTFSVADLAGNAQTTLSYASGSSASTVVTRPSTDVTAPTVRYVTSSTADGSYKSGGAISVQVVFSEPVTVVTSGGTPTLTLETGTTDRAVSYASGTGTTTLTFNYTVQAGDTSSDLDYVATTSLATNGGTIKDAANLDASLTLATPGATNSLRANKALVIDTTAPTVVSVESTDANGTFYAEDVVVITVTFSENVSLSGTPSLQLNTTPTQYAYADAPSGTKIIMTYTVVCGDAISGNADLDYATTTALALAGGSITDAVGNSASLTLPTVGGVDSLAGNQNFKISGSTVDGTVACASAPTVSGVSSSTSNGSYKAGASVSIQVTFSASVTVTGTPTLTLETGTSDQTVSYASGSPGTSLTFTYTVQAGDTSSDLDYVSTSSLSLAGGTITSTADGVDAVLTLATPGAANSLGANKAIVIDTTAPTVSSFSSTTNDGSYKQGQTVNITATTSEAVQSGNTLTVTLETGATDATVTLTAASAGTSLTGTYTVSAGDTTSDLTVASFTIGTVADTAGNAMTSTTVPSGANNIAGAKAIVIDTTAPTVTSWTPPSSPSSSRTLTYTLAFSESVSGIASEDFSNAGGTATGCTFTPSAASGSSVTVTVVCSSDGTVVLRLASGGVSDTATNTGPASNSDASSVTITTTGVAPTVVSVSISSTGGSDNTLIVGEVLQVTVTYDSSVTVTGTPQIPVILTNATRNASYASGSPGTALVFEYTIVAGDIDDNGASIALNTLSLNGGTIKKTGEASTNATITHAAVAAADGVDEVDGVAPTFSSASVNVAGTQLTMTFSEALSATTATSGRFTVTAAGASVNVTGVTVSGSTVVLDLAGTVKSGEAVTVAYTDPTAGDDTNAVQDSAGNDTATLSATSATNNSTQSSGGGGGGGGTTTTTAAPATTTTVAATTTTTVAAATTTTTTTSTTTTIASRRITICHATASRTNPYVAITVDLNGLNGHGGHTGDIIPAPAAGCSRAAVAAATSTTSTTSTTLAPTTTLGRGRPGATTTTVAPTTTLPERQRITICHATKSSTNPYVEITVDLDGLNGHGDHGDDIIPAPAGGCDARAVKDAAKEAETVAKKIEAKEKITICHATSSETNPFVEITIDTDGLAGHADHAGDIIPAPAGGCAGPSVKKATEVLTKNNGRITICHATSSATNPFVEITVDMDGLNGHGDHQNDIIPAPSGGCPKQITPDVKEKMVRANERITICHATGSATNPYVEITIDTSGLAGHGDHPDDIIPAPADGCSKQTIAKELDNRKKPNGKITICHATSSTKNPYVEITIDIDGLSGHGDHLDDIIPAPLGGCGQKQVDDRLKELGIKDPETVDICHATKDANRPYVKETVAYESLDGHGEHNGDIVPAPAAGCTCGAIDAALQGKTVPPGSLTGTLSQVNAERNGGAATDLYELVEPNAKKSGTRSGSVTLAPESGAPSMQLLSATVDGGGATAKVTSSGVDYNKPATWQAEGFGEYCWKLEPFGDNDYRYLLPAPSAPPDGRFAGRPYSAVIVKAGSIRESDPAYQVNTTFMNPAGGTEVFADVNRNGISDPGGQGGGLLGDKAISHIILCVGEGEFKEVVVTTTTSTTVPENEPVVVTTTTIPDRVMVNACPKPEDRPETSTTTTTTSVPRTTTTSSSTTTTTTTSSTSTTVRPTTSTSTSSTSTTVRPTTTTVRATTTTASSTTTTVRPTTTTIGVSGSTTTTVRPTTTTASSTTTTVRPTTTTASSTTTTVRATTTTASSTTTTVRPTTTTASSTTTTVRPTTTTSSTTSTTSTSTTSSSVPSVTTTTIGGGTGSSTTTSTTVAGAGETTTTTIGGDTGTTTTTTIGGGTGTTTTTTVPGGETPLPLQFDIVAPPGKPLPKDATVTVVVSTGTDIETMVLTIDLVNFEPTFDYPTVETKPVERPLETLPTTGGPRWTREQQIGWLLATFGLVLLGVTISVRRRRHRRRRAI